LRHAHTLPPAEGRRHIEREIAALESRARSKAEPAMRNAEPIIDLKGEIPQRAASAARGLRRRV